MEPIIQPVDKKLIKKELTKDKFLRHTNNGGNKLYIVDHHDSPSQSLPAEPPFPVSATHAADTGAKAPPSPSGTCRARSS